MGPAPLEGAAVTCLASLLLVVPLLAGSGETDKPAVLVVVGAAGTEEYGRDFRTWADRWKAAAEHGGAEFHSLGNEPEGKTSDRERLEQQLGEVAKTSSEPLWIVLIGHGTFDGKTARFNLRGPDVSAAELAAWLQPLERPLAIVNCTSASAPFLQALSGKDRVVITATKSGHEHNFARFGDYLSAAIADPQADLDKDEQTSLLEAFLQAAAGVKEFYGRDSRLVTEHALLDDNGDRLGTSPDWFSGVRATKVAKDGAAPDGLRAHQLHLVRSAREQELASAARARRDELELQLAERRARKTSLSEEAYLREIEPLLLELARLYQATQSKAENK